MSNFIEFKKAVNKQFSKMSKHKLFRTKASKDESYEVYLNSFEEGTNLIFREKTEHDCQCCKRFIRAVGNVVAIIDNKFVSIWDVEVPKPYQVVADAMSSFVKSKEIGNIFMHDEPVAGVDFNYQLLEDGAQLKWNHFYYKIPNEFVNENYYSILGKAKSNKITLKTSLDKISLESLNIVNDLISQNSLLRGTEKKKSIKSFIKIKKAYSLILDTQHEQNFLWLVSLDIGELSKIKNSAIGTLLVDLTEGLNVTDAVNKYNKKVDPSNYKRSNSVMTKGMVKKLIEVVDKHNLKDSLDRRFSVLEDITVNNTIFADRSVKKAIGGLDGLMDSVKEKPKNFNKVEEVPIEYFIENIVPKATSLELMLENKHENNLVSLISPVNKDSTLLFKWPNNLSWSYKGEVTDSIKERVKRAGGNVNAVKRTSVSWHNRDDYDIHAIEPNGNHIFFDNKGIVHPSSGKLDVDMNASLGSMSENPVENIVWTDKNKMQEGLYKIYIHNYSCRQRTNYGFDLEFEYEGKVITFSYDKFIKQKEDVHVIEYEFSRKNGIKILNSLSSNESSKDIWGISTNKFHKVKILMNSPNFWDGKEIGNKHWFFMLENCNNDKQAIGFYNEFARSELHECRKALEHLSQDMKTKLSDNQLSGLGFSSTQRNSVLCKVGGSFNRIVKIIF